MTPQYEYPYGGLVEFNESLPMNADAMLVLEGLALLGIKDHRFRWPDIEDDKYKKAYKVALFVGSAKSMRTIFTRLEVLPPPMDYPQPLVDKGFLGRSVWQQQTGSAVDDFRRTGQPFFIKSVDHKVFSGILIREERQLTYLESYYSVMAWISEPMTFTSEWRCFVHKGELVDARPYRGDFRRGPDFEVVAAMIEAFTEAPIAYTLDVGLNSAGNTCLVEVNDFWAVDSYGLEAERYTQMLIDRYRQIIEPLL